MLQQDIKRTGRASSEERIKKLKARLHSLATRIPVIGLKRVEDVYPALQYNMTIHVTSAITDDTIIDGSNHKRRREASLKQRTSFYITCQRCQKSYIHQESFNTHECKCYTCKICEKSFPYYAFLKRHWSSHSNQRPWRCDKCDKSFKCERDLMQHGRMAHDDNKTCRYCGKIFSRKSSLVNHLKTHNSRHTKGTDVQKATDSKEKQDTDEYRTDSGSRFIEKNSENMEQQNGHFFQQQDLQSCLVLNSKITDKTYSEDHNKPDNFTCSDAIQEKQYSRSSGDSLRCHSSSEENLADMTKQTTETNLEPSHIEICEQTAERHFETTKSHLEESSEMDTGKEKNKVFLEKTIEDAIENHFNSKEPNLEETNFTSENFSPERDLNVENNSEQVTQKDHTSFESHIEKTSVQDIKTPYQPLQVFPQTNLSSVPMELKNNCSSIQINSENGTDKYVFERNSLSLEQ